MSGRNSAYSMPYVAGISASRKAAAVRDRRLGSEAMSMDPALVDTFSQHVGPIDLTCHGKQAGRKFGRQTTSPPPRPIQLDALTQFAVTRHRLQASRGSGSGPGSAAPGLVEPAFFRRGGPLRSRGCSGTAGGNGRQASTGWLHPVRSDKQGLRCRLFRMEVAKPADVEPRQTTG